MSTLRLPQPSPHLRPLTPALSRRAFLGASLTAAAIAACTKNSADAPQPDAAASAQPLFGISLAEWSLHRALRAGTLDHLDFPAAAKEDYGIDAVEYVNTFFKKKGDDAYVNELRKRCDDAGVQSVLIMCDGEGDLGDPNPARRAKAVENHYKWVEAGRALGCHSIRVNAQSAGSFEQQQDLAADGLRRLCLFADNFGLNVIVENHWGLSSNGQWLAGVMRKVGHPRIGTLPDFGNFDPKQYDRYQGVADMMPWARGVSAKSYDFDPATGETDKIDYRKMLKIVIDAGYRGRLGIEYEGSKQSEPDGIRMTKALLERVRAEMSKA
ncbi:MAG: sugar phosphate isomerase/epimerase [Phycisphaerales bacterium]|nr:sugar phosphate isomerase/epimerase [Phycisphaerales bacterium]